MAVRVAFVSPVGVHSIDVQVLSGARHYESLTIPASTSGAAQSGEIAVVVNDEASTVLIATGTTPDAATADSTTASTAGVPVAAGDTAVFFLNAGDKVNAKAAT